MNIFLILAKSNSLGLADKHLQIVNNETLLERELRDVLSKNCFDQYYISSDSIKILDIAKRFNFKCIKRPESLTSNDEYLNSVKHAINNIKGSISTITISQVVQPLKSKNIYKKILGKHKKNVDSVVTATKFNSSPKWIYKKKGKSLINAKSVKYENIISRENDLYEIDNKIVSFTYDSFIKWKSITPWPYLGEKIILIEDVVLNPNLRVDINSKEDLDWFRIVKEKLID